MKRDMDLLRSILIFLEEKEDDVMINSIPVDGFSENEVMYHLILMDQAGLIRCERIVSGTTQDKVIHVYPHSLTWKGHEFLDAARNEDVWNKAKSVSMSKLGSISFEIISSLLIEFSKKTVGLG